MEENGNVWLGEVGAVSAELCEQVKRNRKNLSRHDRHRFHNGALIRVAPATVSAGWLWEMCPAIAARVRDRNPMEVADDLGHRFWGLLPFSRLFVQNLIFRLPQRTLGL